MKNFWLSAVAVVLLLSTAPMHAQGGGVDGCVNSPENPTAILAVAGAAGAGISHLRARWKAKKTDRN